MPYKKTLFENICKDVLANIADYLTYEDHKSLCKVSNMWRYAIMKYTMYFKFNKFVKNNRLTKKNKILQFYYSCSYNKLNLAKDIYWRYSLGDLDIISSVFYYKVVEPKYCTILAILKSMNFDFSIYKFLQSEEQYISSISTIQDIANSFALSNKSYESESSAIFCTAGSKRFLVMEILHCFVRQFRERVVQNINECCICADVDELEFLCRFLKGGENLLDAMIYACMCKKTNIFKWMLEREEFKKFAPKAFVRMCYNNDRLDFMKMIDKAVDLSQETFKEAFTTSCMYEQFENANWIKTFKLREGISENIKLQIFMKCQQNSDSLSNFQILELIYPIESLQKNVLKESFLDACIKGKPYLVKFLMFFFELPFEVKIEGFINCCLYDHVKLAKFFNKNIKIDPKIIQDAFYGSICKKSLKVVTWLQSFSPYECNLDIALELTKESDPSVRKWLLNIMNGHNQ